MDRVAWIVVSLYLTLLTIFTLPYLLITFPPGSKEPLSFSIITQFYGEPGLWMFFGFILLCQIALLMVPVRKANERPIGRVPVWVTILVGAFFMAAMIYSLLLCLSEVIASDNLKHPWLYTVMPIFFVSWAIWAYIFYRAKVNLSANKMHAKVTQWMLRGSILEVLIAIPSHVYVRQKDYCCAGFMTFFGLTTGVCVMLLAFGPGVYYLYRSRIEQKRSS